MTPIVIHRFRRVACLVSAGLFAGPLQAKVDFAKQILPVLEKKCMDCHKAPFEENGRKKEPKADLRLDAAWAIMKGGENGPVLKPGSADKSMLYEVVTLPEDDDMHMPSKGDDLTPDEMKLLKQWIDEGADFGGWEGSTEGKPADAFTGAKSTVKTREHEAIYGKLSEGLKPPAEDVIKKVSQAGAQVAVLKPGSGLVRVDFLTGVSACTDAKVEALLAIKDHIAQLDLGRTAITDAALNTAAKFPRLVTLDLRMTKVTDAGLEPLSALRNLRTLNLYGTAVSDAGLKHLAAIKSLKSVYLWQSKATEAGAKQLASAIPGVQVTLK